MRKVLMTMAALSVLTMLIASPAEAFNRGCYRLGETGYHWYHFCVGFNAMYPHHRVCRNGNCWYR